MSSPSATATATATTGAATAAADAPKKKSKKPLMLGIVVGALAAGGGGYYAMSSGLLGGDDKPKVDPHTPVLELEEGSDAEHPRYKTSYYKLDGAFTTNLQNSPRFVQLELGVATRYDARVIERVKTHDLPIRSAVLGILAQTPEEAVATPAGRAALQRQLKAAVNAVLMQKEGFGGVDDVYFAGLVVQ